MCLIEDQNMWVRFPPFPQNGLNFILYIYTDHCNCGNTISKYSNSNRCRRCYEIDMRVVDRPPHDQLIKDIKELGYKGTGKKYGVSDNSIRKWIKR